MVNRFITVIYRVFATICTLLALWLVATIDQRSTTRNDFFSGMEKRHCVEEDEEEEFKDGPAEALAYEIEITKDPSTGIVPRERLVEAYRYMTELEDRQRLQRAAGAIAGVSWRERGPNNCGGRTRAIMVDPNDPTKRSVFAAGVGGGLWKTTDITAVSPVWTAVNDFFSNIAITTIAHDPTATQTIYFGTGEGFYNADAIRGLGVWKSTNGGSTFTQLTSTNNSNFFYIIKIVVHPTTGHVFVATRAGLYKSKDGGTSFTKVLGAGSGASINQMSDVEIAADGSVWAGMGSGGTDGIYRAPASGATTGDAGTYVKLNTASNGFPTTGFDRIEIACAPSNSATTYVLLENNANSDLLGVWRTTNTGANWTQMTSPVDADGGVTPGFTRTQAWYDLTIAVDPNNANTIFAGGIDLFKSTNGGSAWAQISHWYGGFGFQEVHADQHTIVFEPGSSSVIYFGNDGGVYRTSNGTASMPILMNKNSGYNVTQFYACAMHPTAYSNYFLAGAQDNGSHQFQNPGMNSTVEVTGGDGCFTHIDQDQPNFQWTSYVYNNYYRSTNGGASFSSVSFGNTGSFVNPTDYDNVSNVMYCAISGGNYMRWTDPQTGNTTATIGITAFNGASVRHISVSPNTPNRVFFGLSNGRVVRVDNANTIATGSAGTLLGTPATGNVSCIAIEPGNDNHILVTYSNYGINSVFECTNALAATPTFTSVEGNLPDMPVRWALFNPSNAQQAMLATEVGVWTTDLLSGTATSWGPSSTGLAHTRVTMLQIRSSDNMVVASTHGRGLFTTDAFMTTPYSDFAASPLVSYTNKPIQFSDGSYKATSWAWDFGDGTSSNTKNPQKSYTNPGVYTVTLVINGNSAYTRTRTSYIQVLPDRGTPYLVGTGLTTGNAGGFEVNAAEFGAWNVNGTPFQRGSSAVAAKSGTFAGTNAWVTGLTATNYLSNSLAYLYCPNFNLAAAGTYTLSFYGKWAFESNWDGFNVEFSLDKGSTWTVIPAATSWYNSSAVGATAFAATIPFFTGTVSSWTRYSRDISFLAGNSNVAFRFAFRSDGSANMAGVALDNFEISGASNTPLPVSLLSFDGENEGDVNQLRWTTASEINNAGFDVERSAEGTVFEKIGFVTGADNSTAINNYKYDDANLTAPYYYYRLRQVDHNGVSEYSRTIFIRRADRSKPFVLMPNPAKERFYLLLKSDQPTDVSVKVFSAGGELVYSSQSNVIDGRVVIEPKEVADGIYFVSVEIGAQRYTERVVISRR